MIEFVLFLTGFFTLFSILFVVKWAFKKPDPKKLKEDPFQIFLARRKKAGILLLFYLYIITPPFLYFFAPDFLFYITAIFLPLNLFVILFLFVYKPISKALNSKNQKTTLRKRIFTPVDDDFILMNEPEVKVKAKDLARHIHVLATTGAGKTKSYVGPLVAQAIEKGCGVLIIDPKGDTEMLSAIGTLLERLGRKTDFKYFDLANPEISCTYNPLKNGEPSQIATRILATMPRGGGTATFYEEKQKEALRGIIHPVEALIQSTVAIGKRKGKAINFVDFYALISELPDSLRWLMDELKKTGAFKYLNELHRIGIEGITREALSTKGKYREWLTGLQQHISKFAFGLKDPSIINSYTPDIDLIEDLHKGRVVYFNLAALSYPGGEAYELGTMILMDLQYVVYWRQKNGLTSDFPIFVIVDEAQHVMSPEFLATLEMGRSAGVSVSVIHQAIQQFDEKVKGMSARVEQNTGLKLILQIKDPETAKYYSELSGQELKKFITETKGGDPFVQDVVESVFPNWRISTNERYDYVVRPEEFFHLKPGEGVLFPHTGKPIKGKLPFFADFTPRPITDVIPAPPSRTGKEWKSENGLCLTEIFKRIKREETKELREAIANIISEVLGNEEEIEFSLKTGGILEILYSTEISEKEQNTLREKLKTIQGINKVIFVSKTYKEFEEDGKRNGEELLKVPIKEEDDKERIGAVRKKKEGENKKFTPVWERSLVEEE